MSPYTLFLGWRAMRRGINDAPTISASSSILSGLRAACGASRPLPWTPEDRAILRARASQAADLVTDLRTAIKVYSDYIATLNL